MKIDDSKNKNQEKKLKNQIDAAINKIGDLAKSNASINDAQDLEAVENEIFQATDELGALIAGLKAQEAVNSQEIENQCYEIVRAAPHKMKNQGPREFEIQTTRGTKVTIVTSYYSRNCLKGRRKKKRPGLIPAFILFGIYDRLTPGLVSDIASFSVICSSFEETCQIFKNRGIEIGANKVRKITYSFGKRAEAIRAGEKFEFIDSVSDLRVVVSTDGGRIRIRKKKTGPKTRKGRNRYTTDWKEPKLLIIYTVDKNGRRDRSFSPFIDGTMKGPNAVFRLIRFYLNRLEICKVDKLLFVADGASWIWRRVPALIESLGVPKDRCYELLDFYHAVEHLGKVAELKKGWKKTRKTSWVKKHRKMLLKGKVDEVIAAIGKVCKGRLSKKLRTEKNYFLRNRKRMCYNEIQGLGLPMGSGAMESAIRRVVNLRLKGPAIYWEEGHAEQMLLLRSFFKAGRWDMVKNVAFSGGFGGNI